MINTFKEITPKSILPIAKTIYNQYQNILMIIDIGLLRVVSISPLLSSLYYIFISSQFRREQQAVINGRLNYYKNLNFNKKNTYLLRRNIHRLEKGLIMRPRRDIFAIDYIEETVNTYCNCVQEREKVCTIDDELQWSHDVLKQYFKVTAPHPTIDKARKFFLEVEALGSEHYRIPYIRELDKPPSVNYEQFLELCYRRRSVRWYEQKSVPRELIDKAITAASLSPSACNRQPFEFRIFDEPELVQRVASLAGGVKGFCQNFPVIIVVVGKLRAYFNERDRHIIYIDASLASMSFMYALETMGLSSCSINWPDIFKPEEEMKSLLKLEHDERPIMLISLGYPKKDAMVPYSQKKNLEQMRRYN